MLIRRAELDLIERQWGILTNNKVITYVIIIFLEKYGNSLNLRTERGKLSEKKLPVKLQYLL